MTLNLNNENFDISDFVFIAAADDEDNANIIYRVECNFALTNANEIEDIEAFSAQLIDNLNNIFSIQVNENLIYTFENYSFENINFFVGETNTFSISFCKKIN